MSNYTTQTAALKATTIDARALNAKQIDTKKLFINGELFDPSQIKESPNQAFFNLTVLPSPDIYAFECTSHKQLIFEEGDERYEYNAYENFGHLVNGSETNGMLKNGVYVILPITDSFLKCIGGDLLDGSLAINNIINANFSIYNYQMDKYDEVISVSAEQCMLENFFYIFAETEEIGYAIKLYEEDDNLTELYGGPNYFLSGGEYPIFSFIISKPYHIPEITELDLDSIYSLRNRHNSSLFEKNIQITKQHLQNIKQRVLDKSAE